MYIQMFSPKQMEKLYRMFLCRLRLLYRVGYCSNNQSAGFFFFFLVTANISTPLLLLSDATPESAYLWTDVEVAVDG